MPPPRCSSTYIPAAGEQGCPSLPSYQGMCPKHHQIITPHTALEHTHAFVVAQFKSTRLASTSSTVPPPPLPLNIKPQIFTTISSILKKSSLK